MTATNPTRKPRRWPWMVGGAIAVALLVSSVAIFNIPREIDEPTATPTETASAAPTGVDACLGGPDLTGESLLSAQRAAERTPEGAVSYAAAFGRYLYQVPWPEDVGTVASYSMMSSITWDQWETAFQEWAGPSPLQSTTVNGSYKVQSYTPDEAVITIVLPWVVDGAISPTKSFGPTLTLRWAVGSQWSVADLDAAAANDAALTTGSTAFTGGC